MRRAASIVVALVASAAAFHCGTASAQGRGPSAQERRAQIRAGEFREQDRAADPTMRAARRVELETWLGRLAGRYDLAGEARILEHVGPDCLEGNVCYSRGKVAGLASCTAFETGAGIHCTINGSWPRFFRRIAIPEAPDEITWRGPYMDIAKLLFGIDPDRLGIRLLLVDGQSKAIEALGYLKDDAVAFRVQCAPDPEASNCPVLRIREFPDRGRIEMEYLDYERRSGASTSPWLSFRFVLR